MTHPTKSTDHRLHEQPGLAGLDLDDAAAAQAPADDIHKLLQAARLGRRQPQTVEQVPQQPLAPAHSCVLKIDEDPAITLWVG